MSKSECSNFSRQQKEIETDLKAEKIYRLFQNCKKEKNHGVWSCKFLP